MGTWSESITGNDTAQDLLDEYRAAFFKFDVDTAVKKIDEYVRTMFDETDEEEFCSYFYSLADFMWKKGILTDDIRDRAVSMVLADDHQGCGRGSRCRDSASFRPCRRPARCRRHSGCAAPRVP